MTRSKRALLILATFARIDIVASLALAATLLVFLTWHGAIGGGG